MINSVALISWTPHRLRYEGGAVVELGPPPDLVHLGQIYGRLVALSRDGLGSARMYGSQEAMR
jgi:hypothetical protein